MIKTMYSTLTEVALEAMQQAEIIVLKYLSFSGRAKLKAGLSPATILGNKVGGGSRQNICQLRGTPMNGNAGSAEATNGNLHKKVIQNFNASTLVKT